jgi:arginase
LGHEVAVEWIEIHADFQAEIASAFELNRVLAAKVEAAVRAGEFPLVLCGNCDSCLGVLAGLGPLTTGVVWLDAHGEFNTPETTASGLLDGMPLTMATGRCWKAMLNTVPGFEPVPDEHIVLVGARDLDEPEQEDLRESRITVVRSENSDDAAILADIGHALDGMDGRVEGIYFHIDMDGIDLDGRRSNYMHTPGGLKPELAERIIDLAKGRYGLRAATIAGYDPEVDPEGVTVVAGIGLIEGILA